MNQGRWKISLKALARKRTPESLGTSFFEVPNKSPKLFLGLLGFLGVWGLGDLGTSIISIMGKLLCPSVYATTKTKWHEDHGRDGRESFL
jgi:hypothetical protein